MAVGILLALLGLWLMVRLVAGGLAGRLAKELLG